jgi:hypothetical protein
MDFEYFPIISGAARDCNYSHMSKDFFTLMKNPGVYGTNRPED